MTDQSTYYNYQPLQLTVTFKPDVTLEQQLLIKTTIEKICACGVSVLHESLDIGELTVSEDDEWKVNALNGIETGFIP